MIPEPSRKPFHFPVPGRALAYFCHPVLDPFAAPVRHGTRILAASGYCAIRFDRIHADPGDFPEATGEFLSRWDKLPWHLIDNQTGKEEWLLAGEEVAA